MKQEFNTQFTPYQKLVILILALLQFVIILDFMIIAPIGDLLIKTLDINTDQFGLIVSSYAFSAAISGIAIAGFADKFDRKKMLLFVLTGFILGTWCCGISDTYIEMLMSRIITGIFAGITSSTLMTIVADIFVANMRGRVMGVIQMGFGLSQILGIPFGIFIAAHWHWHNTFMFIVLVTIVIALLVAYIFKPINAHLETQQKKNAFAHLLETLKNQHYRVGFFATAFLSIGGFMLMPFSSIFLVNNVGITNQQLSIIFLCTGLSSLVAMPIIGKLSDKYDRFRMYAIATLLASAGAIIYTNLSVVPLVVMVFINMIFFAIIMSRMTPAMALNSMMPKPEDRGAYMSISSSLQQTAGGVGSIIAGMVVIQQSESSPLEHYDILGYITVSIFLISIYLVRRVDLILKLRSSDTEQPVVA
jgi:predicted MFS family arabinose efflux permease